MSNKRFLQAQDNFLFAKDVAGPANAATSYETFGPVRYLMNHINAAHPPNGAMQAFQMDLQKARTCLWFQQFIKADRVQVSGTVAEQKVALLSLIEIKTQRKGLTGAAVATDFSTATALRTAQFGDKAVQLVDEIGYCEQKDALLFALDRCDQLQLGDFLDSMEFKCAAWVAGLLNLIPLKPVASSSKLPRSGIWYQPPLDDRTTLRMEMELDMTEAAADSFSKFLKEKLGLVTIPKMTVIGKKTHETQISDEEIIALRTYSEIYIQTTLSWPMDGNNPFNVNLVLGLGDSGLDLVIQFTVGSNPWDALFTWLNGQMKVSGWATLDSSLQASISDAMKRIGSSIILRQASILFTESKKIGQFEIAFEIPLTFGAPDGKSVSLLAGIKWNPGHVELSGEI